MSALGSFLHFDRDGAGVWRGGCRGSRWGLCEGQGTWEMGAEGSWFEEQVKINFLEARFDDAESRFN